MFRYSKNYSKLSFSFLELMVVIVIVAVVSAIAAPRFSNFYSNLKLNNNIRQLKFLFEYARNTALVKRRTCTVFYNAKNNSFSLKLMEPEKKDSDDDSYESSRAFVEQPKYQNVGGVFREIKLSNGVKLTSAQEMGALPVPQNTDFSFDIFPYGIDNAYKFTFENNNNDEISIVLMAGSAIPKVYKKGTRSYYGE